MVATGSSGLRKLAGNLLVGGVLAVFVAGTYWKTLHNVSSDDLERELERELAEEERRQAREAAKLQQTQ